MLLLLALATALTFAAEAVVAAELVVAAAVVTVAKSALPVVAAEAAAMEAAGVAPGWRCPP